MTPAEAASLLTIAAAFDKSVVDRFLAKVEVTEDCWLWQAADDGYGYGAFSIDGRIWKAHRAAYTMANGPIPIGLLIDHRCHNRACVNPAHLQAVTSQGNLQNRIGANVNNRSSGIRGVSWSNTRNKWVVLVGHDRQRHYMGMYDSLDDAEAAAVAARNGYMTNNLLDRRVS